MVKGSSARKLRGVSLALFSSSTVPSSGLHTALPNSTGGVYFSGSTYKGFLAQTAMSASSLHHGDLCHRSDSASTMSVQTSTNKGHAQAAADSAVAGPSAAAPGRRKNTGLGWQRRANHSANLPTRRISSCLASASGGLTQFRSPAARGKEQK